MAKVQKWAIEVNGEMHGVEYTPRKFFSKASIKIDNKVYPLLSAKLFGSSQEAFILGGERAAIMIDKRKHATILVDNEKIKEI